MRWNVTCQLWHVIFATIAGISRSGKYSGVFLRKIFIEVGISDVGFKDNYPLHRNPTTMPHCPSPPESADRLAPPINRRESGGFNWLVQYKNFRHISLGAVTIKLKRTTNMPAIGRSYYGCF